MEMNSRNITAFRQDLKEALKSFEKKYDATISLGTITYSDTQFYGS